MLKQRIITAIILIPLMVAIVFYLPSTSFFFFTALVTLLAAWEWTTLMGLQSRSAKFLYIVLMSAIFAGMLLVPIPLVLMVASGWWVLTLLMIAFYPRMTGWWRNNITVRGLMGMMTLVPCWVAINYIRNLGNGDYALLYLFVLIWGADSVAYFAGKKWGSIKLAPKVSPGKTIQGVAGALVFAIFASIAIISATGAPKPLWLWLEGLSLLTVVISIVGDLFESMLKRNVDVKDSGVMIPGHGGLLDRIDSLTAAAPVYGLCVFLMMVLAY